jgi:DNA helicase IV
MRHLTYLDLSASQQDLLIGLPFEGRHLVTGPPGSGKTLLAIHRAAMLDIAGQDVQLITYSNLLRQYTALACERLELNGKVTTFHKWFHGFWRRRFGKKPPPGEREGSFDWSEIIGELVRSGTAIEGEMESLVVDEGQDLPKEFYLLCTQLAANVTVFADDNQRIGEDQSTLPEIHAMLGEVTNLWNVEENHRNSRQIADFAARFYCGPTDELPHPPLRSGPAPTLARYRSEGEFVDHLVKYTRANPEFEIGVALKSTRAQIYLVNELQRRGAASAQTYVARSRQFRAVDFAASGIRVFSIFSMKGLEFDALFVPQLNLYNEDPSGAAVRMRFYVLATRARQELHMSHETEQEPPLVADIPHSILHRL